MKYARETRRGGWQGRLAALAVLGAVALLVWGCSEPVTTYRVADRQVSGGDKVLVLPFQDTRTFTDPNDTYRETLGTHGRDIFVAAIREHPAIANATILTPDVDLDGSVTIAQAADLGRRHGADVVVTGQVFSFTETRAASIPPRAGMFVRVVSAKNGSLLFVGDHYLSAAVPAASGGRELQAKNVANKLIESMVDSVKPLAMRAASHTALAMLAAAEEYESRPTADPQGGKASSDSDEPAPLPVISSGSLFDSMDWDSQPTPELPTVITYSNDLYATQPKPLPQAEREPFADPAEFVPAPAPVAVAVADPIDAAADAADDRLANQPLPMIPDSLAVADEPQPEEPVAEVAEVKSEPPMPVPLPPPSLSWDEEDAGGLAVAEDADDFEEEIPALVGTDSMAADQLAAAPVEPEAEVMAEVVDHAAELAEPELADADTAEEPDKYFAEAGADADIEAEAVLPSGDELAMDLFALQGEVELAMRREEIAAPVVAPIAAPVRSESAPVVESEPVAVAAVVEPVLTGEPTVTESQRLAISEDFAFSTDMTQSQYIAAMEPQVGILSVTPEPIAAAPTYEPQLMEPEFAEAPAVVADTLYEPPVAFEQPRPIKLLDNSLPEDPTSALVGAGPEIAAPQRFASPGAVRVLILPYHDRENPNNLIPHTGGGEVVTSLYGSQLALDPGVQILWDSTGKTSHASLVTIDEALEFARQAKADYVVRGQVVEFRRAQSVPSFYSVVISTAVLAAQIFFAEMSGVDVATEVYRVSDGACIMSRRDRAQQKYVVQAEKTVRRMAEGMARDVLSAVKSSSPEIMDPLIDELSPVTVLSNP